MTLTVSAPWASAAEPTLEYQVKASSIFNFLHFMSWPESAVSDERTINVCVLGEDRFGEAIDILNDELVRGASVRVRKLAVYDRDWALQCKVLFISDSMSGQLGRIFLDLENRSILTVGESRDFLRSGGMINFVVIENRLQFELDRSALRRAGLTASANLLKLSR